MPNDASMLKLKFLLFNCSCSALLERQKQARGDRSDSLRQLLSFATQPSEHPEAHPVFPSNIDSASPSGNAIDEGKEEGSEHVPVPAASSDSLDTSPDSPDLMAQVWLCFF